MTQMMHVSDRLRTISLSGDSNQTGMVKPVYDLRTFQPTAKAVLSKVHILQIPRTSAQGKKTERPKIITRTSKVIKQYFRKYKDVRQSRLLPPVWKRAQVLGLTESRLAIKGTRIRTCSPLRKFVQVP